MAKAPQLDTALPQDITSFLKRFVILPTDHHYLIASTWIIHTWAFEACEVTPYLLVTSTGPGSGKTRFLDALAMLVRNAKRAENMTPVVMFELIERECPTLLIDEVDTVYSGSRNESMRNILNTGYKKGGSAWRIRAREVKEFRTLCPKVLAGINNGFLPATVKDRCIPFELAKRKPNQKVERFKESKVSNDPQREELLERIWAFKEGYHADLMVMAPEPMTSLSDRQDEISEPLLAIAAVLGYESRLRHAIESVFTAANGKAAPSPEQTLLRRIHDAFAGRPKIHTDELCAALGPMYNGRTLAIWLERFNIMPKNVRIGSDVKRGYTADQFMGVWSTYLAPTQPSEEEAIAA